MLWRVTEHELIRTRSTSCRRAAINAENWRSFQLRHQTYVPCFATIARSLGQHVKHDTPSVPGQHVGGFAGVRGGLMLPCMTD
jgi:hypothetical protein